MFIRHYAPQYFEIRPRLWPQYFQEIDGILTLNNTTISFDLSSNRILYLFLHYIKNYVEHFVKLKDKSNKQV
jgi:hypothetical protein